jgi:hypothetical protein
MKWGSWCSGIGEICVREGRNKWPGSGAKGAKEVVEQVSMKWCNRCEVICGNKVVKK